MTILELEQLLFIYCGKIFILSCLGPHVVDLAGSLMLLTILIGSVHTPPLQFDNKKLNPKSRRNEFVFKTQKKKTVLSINDDDCH